MGLSRSYCLIRPNLQIDTNQNRLGTFDFVWIWSPFLTLFRVLEISEETDEMRRQSNRYSCVMPGEQQITQYLIENPLINAILDDDEEKVNQLIRLGFWASNWLHSQVQIMKHKNNDSNDLFWEYS